MARWRFCQHTKDNGELCGSPAMRGKRFCYFHREVLRRRKRLAQMEDRRRLLEEAKLYVDRILGANSYVIRDLTPYSRVNHQTSRFCTQEGEGGGRTEITTEVVCT